MSKNKESNPSTLLRAGLVPKLRFPQFANEKDWEVKVLGKVCDYWNGGSHESGVDENGEYYLISLNSIDIEGKLKSEMKRISYTDNSLQKGDLVMVLSDVAHGNFLGLTDIIPNDKYVLNQRMAGLRIKNISSSNPFFIRTFINYNQKYFKSNGQGSSQLNLSKSSVTDFPILLPTIQEQQQIASCLSSLDEVITAESQKLDVLKEHKKGLLQNLFPHPLTNSGHGTVAEPAEAKVPKLRFKEFKGEWEEKKLGEVVDKVGSGVTPLGGESNYKKSGRPFVRSQNVGWGAFILDDVAFIDEETHRNQISTELKTEDVLLNITGASIGRSAVANEKINGGNVNQHVCIIRTVKNILNPFFLNQYLISELGQKQIDSFQAGGNRQGLNFAQIRSLSIPISSLPEQQKIASCLSSLDEMIQVQTEKIELLKQHKKGLLQGLFPDVTNG